MPPLVFEPTISAGEGPKTYALDRAATGTGKDILVLYWKEEYNYSVCMETFESPFSLCTWDGGNSFARNADTSYPNHAAAQLRLCTI